jgi:hypothetical protein
MSALHPSRHLTRKWPFRGHDAYLDRRLCDIRAELGIDVIE